MRAFPVPVLAVLLALILLPTVHAASSTTCPDADAACRDLAKLFDAGEFEQLTASAKNRENYSEASKTIIGQAYLQLAGRETNTPQQEEQYCLKALEYGASSAYMGLYFIHAGSDEKKALGYLRQYVATRPKDAVPYVILGEAELRENNAAAALGYLREAKNVARGKSANVDWLLFQASFLSGDKAAAAAALDSSLAQGKTRKDLHDLLSSDKRFTGIAQLPDFRKYFPAGTDTRSLP